jgi:DNA repair exonuclease SbcCD nuclease subunit
MGKIRFVTSSDEHVADLSPGFRKDDYRATILGKLQWQLEFAERAEANALLRGGDLFHVKAANKVTHGTVQALLSMHMKSRVPTFALSGNHDMSNNDPESVLRQQPLGVLYRSEAMTQLTEKIFEDDGVRVRVVGVEYTHDLDVDRLLALTAKRPDDQYVVAVVHALAAMAPSEKIQSFFNEPIFDYRDLVHSASPDVFVFGHYHKDQGIQEHMGTRFVNLGSISRGSLTFENMERKPKVGLLEFTGNGIHAEEVIVPHKDPAEVFDLSKKKQLDAERRSLDEFVRMLQADTKIGSGFDKDKELAKYPEELRNLALTILEAVEAGVAE